MRRRQFEATGEDEEELLLDYGMHQRRLLPLIARTYALHFAQEVVARQLHDVSSGTRDDEHDDARAGVAGGGHQGARHLARDPHHPGVPRGVRGAGYLVGEPVRRAEGRHRRVHDVRGRQPRAAAARGEGPADRLRQRRSRTSTSSAWSGSSPTSRSRP